MTLFQTSLMLALTIGLSVITLRSAAGKVLRLNYAVRRSDRRKV